MVETSLDDLVSFQTLKRYPQRDGACIFFPYGSMIQEPVLMSYLDVNKEMIMAQKSHLDGYIAIYTRESLLGIVVFSQGSPVAVFGGNGTVGKEAIEYINNFATPSKSYISVYSVDTELMPFVYSLKPSNVKRLDVHFTLYKEAQERIEGSRISGIVMLEGGGIYRYDLFFRGHHVARLVKDKGFLVTGEEDKNRLSVKIENMPESSITLYELNVTTSPSPIEIGFATQAEKAQEAGGVSIDSEAVGKIKDIFVKELGPVGKVLWGRILEELALNESGMNSMQVKVLLERLQEEMPEDSAKEEFLSRVKEALGDII